MLGSTEQNTIQTHTHSNPTRFLWKLSLFLHYFYIVLNNFLIAWYLCLTPRNLVGNISLSATGAKRKVSMRRQSNNREQEVFLIKLFNPCHCDEPLSFSLIPPLACKAAPCKKKADNLTDPSSAVELQNPSHDVPELQRSPVPEALELWKDRSGSKAGKLTTPIFRLHSIPFF